MIYAIIKDSIVVNTIVLNASNAHEFPDAVSVEGLLVGIGDTYDGEHFYHDGEPIHSAKEQLAEARQIIDILTGEVE